MKRISPALVRSFTMAQMYLHARAQILYLYKQKFAWQEVQVCHGKAVYQEGGGGEFPPPPPRVANFSLAPFLAPIWQANLCLYKPRIWVK